MPKLDESDVYVDIDKEKLALVLEYLDGVPPLDFLVGDLVHLTEYDILSQAGEHGGWYAIDVGEAFDDGPAEVGLIVAWRSDSHPIRGKNPCWTAALALGYPAPDWSHWSSGDIDYAIEVFIPEDGRDDEENRDEVYRLLCEQVEVFRNRF